MSCKLSAWRTSIGLKVTLTLYQCFLTDPSVLLGNVYQSMFSFETLVRPQPPNCFYLTFAISAQVLPASRIVFNLCSSAGVQGVFVRLFFAGGCIGEDSVMLGSPAGGGAPEELDGPDIGRGVGNDPDARLLFRGPVGDELSGLTDVSAVVMVVEEG